MTQMTTMGQGPMGWLDGAQEGAPMRFEAPRRWPAPAGWILELSSGLRREDQLGFWREMGAAGMARALFELGARDGSGEAPGPQDMSEWRLMGFLRRHCEALCALREGAGAMINAERALASLSFERVLELALGAPEPSAAGLRKYVSEINGSRPCWDEGGRAMAERSHGRLIEGLAEKLGRLASLERAAVAAGREHPPASLAELGAWIERAELEGCAQAAPEREARRGL